MWELFGLSARHRIASSALPLADFQARGGATADNPDGWGIAWREGGTVHLEREPLPGHGGERIAGVIDPLRSDLVVAHVFVHPCCGRSWVFAPNGLVPDLVTMESANPTRRTHQTQE
jgi:glutamine amidotransferase